jgi:predicted metal-dependent RNase
MSGLEVLELWSQPLNSLSKASKSSTVQDAPNSIGKHKAQVEQLIEIAGLIKNNPPLQTDLVGSILRVCSSEAEKLLEILGKICVEIKDGRVVKLWKTLAGVRKEDKILALFAKLEQGKSTLALCIATIDSCVHLFTL